MAFTKKTPEAKTPPVVDTKNDQQNDQSVIPPVVDPEKDKPEKKEEEISFDKTKPHVAPKAPEPQKFPVNDESQAMKLFKKSYALPAGDEIAYVTQDGNVFFHHNESSAYAHARQNSIKIFTIKP